MNNDKTLIIAAGGVAVSTLEKISDLYDLDNTLYINFSTEINKEDDHHMMINNTGGIVYKNKIPPLTDSSRRSLHKKIQSFNKLILITGLGSNCGTIITNELASLTLMKPVNIRVIAFLPFSFECDRRELSLNLVVRLKEKGITIHVIDHEPNIDHYSASTNNYFEMQTLKAAAIFQNYQRHSHWLS